MTAEIAPKLSQSQSCTPVDRLKQEFITPHCPQQNGMVERVIRTLKEQCVHRQRFDSLQHATPPSATGSPSTITAARIRRWT
nr:integrase core domain-containing protein [Cereibacter sphaeroides]